MTARVLRALDDPRLTILGPPDRAAAAVARPVPARHGRGDRTGPPSAAWPSRSTPTRTGSTSTGACCRRCKDGGRAGLDRRRCAQHRRARLRGLRRRHRAEGRARARMTSSTRATSTASSRSPRRTRADAGDDGRAAGKRRSALQARAKEILKRLEDGATPTRTASSTTATRSSCLCATILSAQCTDVRVNMVTPELFRRYPDAEALARGPARRRGGRSSGPPGSSATRQRASSAWRMLWSSATRGTVPDSMEAAQGAARRRTKDG